MSLFSWLGVKVARGEVNAARQGKRGAEAMQFLKLVDGYKRVILLVAFLVVAWLKAMGVGDYTQILDTLMAVLGWKPDLLPVDVTLITATAAGAWAIFDGMRKASKAKEQAEAIRR